jgi:hypothetical protein
MGHKFTATAVQENTKIFLDIVNKKSLIRVILDTFKKPTATGTVINNYSNHHPGQKIAACKFTLIA